MRVMGEFKGKRQRGTKLSAKRRKVLGGCARARMGVLWHLGLFPQGIGHSRPLLTMHYCFQMAGINQILADLTDRFVS